MGVKKNVPQIRFKGFGVEWEEYPLSTFISSLDAGVSVNSGDRPANESEFGILKTSCVTNGFFEPHENKVVFKAEEISRLKEPVLENTIIISRMNTPALVGANAYISQDFANYFLPDRLWAAKPTFIGDLKFIAYILGSYKGRLALSDLATGTSGSMKNISKPSVLRLMFRAPREQEQTQIGNYFQKLDTLINQHQQKHDKLSNIKKAMLELMFPKQGETVPEIRFKGFCGEWEEKLLSDLCWFQEGPGVRNHQFTTFGVKLFNGTNIEKGKIDLEKTNRYISEKEAYGYYSHFLADAGDVVIACSGVTVAKFEEKVAILEAEHLPLCMNTSTMRFKVKPMLMHRDYLVQFLASSLFKQQISGSATGSAQLNFGPSHVSQVLAPIPSLEEQTAIGNYFQKLDTLINQHQQQMTKLNNIKQACLSKMFV